jgi:hypothetical protein
MLQSLQKMFAVRGRVAELDGSPADETLFREAYQRLAQVGLPLRPYEQALGDFGRLRGAYLPGLVAATTLLLVPLEFRHQTAMLDITRSG